MGFADIFFYKIIFKKKIFENFAKIQKFFCYSHNFDILLKILINLVFI